MITFLRAATFWSDRRLLFTLLIFRFVNAVLVQTSFVPDEYWQCLEVAHRMAFGYGHLTWEWKQGIRGYTFPFLYAIIYKILENFHLDFRYMMVLVPKLVQASLGAICDLFLYKFSRKTFGMQVAFWALLCQLSSWFIFYCYPRTLSNCLETVFTVTALYHYPWNLVTREGHQNRQVGKKLLVNRQYLWFVAAACIVRSTAAVMWAPLCLLHLQKSSHKGTTLFRAFFPVALAAIVLSSSIDAMFYGRWINVHYNFLKFNFLSNIGSFYGSHPWHWYLSQGVPVVLGPQLIPFALGAYQAKDHRVLLYLMLWTVMVYSYLSHKEFRFLLPIVPVAMCYAGFYLNSLWGKDQKRGTPAFVLTVIGGYVNLLLMLYTGLVHQRGTLDVTRHLHQEVISRGADNSTSILFLMPCHSTPFYSHIHRNISMRFLTCEPNLASDPHHRDEAEDFFREPVGFLNSTIFNGKGLSQQPTHIVMFDSLRETIHLYLEMKTYKKTNQFFHTHFPEGRVSSYILVYVKT